nr:RNA-directed DNA polymerase, eukaryota, reverse transcriptase zinc-binding domain protein [Tanacetum cinerariifolium]
MYACEFGLGKAIATRSGCANKADGKITLFPGRDGAGSMGVEICLLPQYMMDLECDQDFITTAQKAHASMPIYHMSLFKVLKKVLHRMESMRSNFFNGADLSSKKTVWVKWKHALASKDKGGLGVSSLFALNRALMFKWVCRFITQGSLLWARVIKALHGYDGKIGQKVKSCYPSLWLDIIHEVEMFKSHGIDLINSNIYILDERLKSKPIENEMKD